MKRIAVFIALLAELSLRASAAEPANLKLVHTIPLRGVGGRFDHFAIDLKGQRLFVAALGNNSLEVIDIAAARRVKSIHDLHAPQGVLYLPEQNQIVVASGDDGTVRFFDGASWELTQKIDSLDDADNIRFDPKTKLIYVGYGDGGLAVIDSTSKKQTGDIKLAGHPESFQLEADGNRIFVNVPDARQIAVVDREKKAVIATWPMKEFRANFPMALDEANHRLFAGCRNPSRLVIFDTTRQQPIGNVEISGDTDDLFYDPAGKRIYLSCGEGVIDVVESAPSGEYQSEGRLTTRDGARTSFFSPELNTLFVAVPQRLGYAAEIRVYQPEKK
jgi:hypothetical protein